MSSLPPPPLAAAAAAAAPVSVSKRFTSYNESENYESLDKARRLFENFVGSPPSLKEALKAADVPNLDDVLADSMRLGKVGREKLGSTASSLTDDEAGAIACYTLELGGEKSLYRIVNTAISSTRSSEGMSTSIKLIYLLLSGLRKLPRYILKAGEKLYRGIPGKVPTTPEEAKGHQYYTEGKDITWWGFTSTTTDPVILNDLLSKSTKKTVFNIEGKNLWGYDIQSFSKFNEKEILLEPEANITVKSVEGQGSSTLTINVDLQPFNHLVLEDIIPVPKASSPVKEVKISSGMIPEGLTVENTIYRGFEISWNPVAGEGNVYQVSMRKSGFFKKLIMKAKTAYEGKENACIIKTLEIGEKYVFWVRCKSGGLWGGWSRSVVKEVDPFNIKMAVNTLKVVSDDANVCKGVLRRLLSLTKDDSK